MNLTSDCHYKEREEGGKGGQEEKTEMEAAAVMVAAVDGEEVKGLTGRGVEVNDAREGRDGQEEKAKVWRRRRRWWIEKR